MTEEILYEVESLGISIRVIDKKRVRHLRFGNDIRQASIDKSNPYKLQTKYARDMVKVFDHCEEPNRILVLGLGAGTIPSYLFNRFPNTLIDVVELLPELKDVASDYFSMPRDDRLKVIIEDGYDYIMNTKHVYQYGLPYDVIFMDIFDKNGTPKKFATDEFYAGLSRKICYNGYVAFNTWISPNSYPRYMNQLKEVFGRVIEQSKSGNHIAFCTEPLDK